MGNACVEGQTTPIPAHMTGIRAEEEGVRTEE